MPIVDGREYRSIDITEFTAIEESFVVEGYATTFDVPYEMYGGYYEQINRSALDNADMSDVIFQYDHQGMVMARQRNNTLAVSCDDHGLFVHADLSGSEQGRNLYEAIKNGLVDRMSWAFMVADDGWEYDRDTCTSIITKVSKVFDVSAVSIPANQDTEIKARSYFDGVIEAENKEFVQREEREQKEKLLLRTRLFKLGE